MAALIHLPWFWHPVQAAETADIEAGKERAAVCAACHGSDGISVTPSFPSLAGQKSAYIMKQLKDFRAGRREDPIMGPQSLLLSDEDIANLAAYYESLSK